MSVGISVIIATYCSGDTLDRLIASLDAQTMPSDEFEMIFVDDGSPDDTVERLRTAAATRVHMTVIEVEHSGWPSRPRNVGIDAALGEYVFFADHDDTLYPDALRRIYEFALENDSDVVNPKESRTSSVWFAMRNMSGGNIANIHQSGGLALLQPLVPHKLYRRALLLEHDIRFPEARRALWEDWYINVPSYRHGAVVSVLADSPVYKWHASKTSATNTFDPAREDYWDRLCDLFEHFRATLDRPDFAGDRRFLTTYTLQQWVIQRLSNLLSRTLRAPLPDEQRAFARACALLNRYGSPEVVSGLHRKHQAFAHLMGCATVEQLRCFALAERHLRANAAITDTRWVDGQVLVNTAVTWHSTDPAQIAYRYDAGVLRLDLGAELARLVPPELLDLTDELDHLESSLAVRDRTQQITWEVPFQTQPATVLTSGSDSVRVMQHGRGIIDPDTAACGRPLPDAVWDLYVRTAWYGVERQPAVSYRAERLPAALGTRAAIAYSNKKGNHSLDLAQSLRTLAIDAAPMVGQIGPIRDFSTTLTAAHATGAGRIPAMLAAVPVDCEPADADAAQSQLERYVAEHRFTAEIVVDDEGARLQGGGDLTSGDYRLYARRYAGLIPTKYGLTVNPAGGAQLVELPI